MRIKFLRIKNFLSIGDEAVEIDFTKYGNIVNILGRNLDAGEGSSNGSGKSSLIEGLVYGLYGKLMKNMSHKEAINCRTKKGLEVEVHWDDYKVIRRRAPDRLQLWKGDEEISLGGIPATDDLIRTILKLNHDSFINVACFGQHNNFNFLSCTASEKRQIAENLLNLDKYLKFNKIAKERHKAAKDKLSERGLLFQQAMQAVDNIRKKHTVLSSKQVQWRNDQLAKIERIESQIRLREVQLLDVKKRPEIQDYEQAQNDLVELEDVVAKKDKIRADLHAIIEKAEKAISQRRDEKQDLSISISSLDREIIIAVQEIAALEKQCDHSRNQEGEPCPHCYGKIDEKNIVRMMERDVQRMRELQTKVSDSRRSQTETKAKLAVVTASLDKLIEGRRNARDKETSALSSLQEALDRKSSLSRVRRPDATGELIAAERDIANLKENMSRAVNELENDPYVDMMSLLDAELKDGEEKIETHRCEVKDIEARMPYLNFWVKAFGDDGIRAFVIDEVIPALNSRINYWLQFLMDGRIKMEFDNQLEETIERNPSDQDPFVYAGLSGGEHTRIDLSISQSFAHVMMMSSNSMPSLVFLDEVAAHVDRPGVQALYKMICELSRDRQVFVITHDPDLLDMLSGHDTITMQLKNGLTTLVK